MDKKIHIIHTTESLEIGGLENGVVNIANNLDSERFTTIICCLRRGGPLKERLAPHVRVICLNEELGFHPQSAFSIARICRKESIDVMHTHGWAGGLYCGVIGAHIARVPLIINGEHGVFYLDTKRRRIAQKLLFGLTHTIVPVSLDLKQDIIRLFGVNPAKIVPIINGVDTQKFKPDMDARRLWRMKLGIKESDFVICTVGRLVQVKDYPTLLRASALIIVKHPGTRLIFIGDGEKHDELMHLAATLGIGANVSFLGARNNVPDLLNMCDVFALTSIDEGLSNVILEAMSTGIPVVATSVGDNPEIMIDGKTGILVPVGNVEAIVSAFSQYLDNSTAKQMGAAGRMYIEEHFSLRRMVKDYEELYVASVKRRG